MNKTAFWIALVYGTVGLIMMGIFGLIILGEPASDAGASNKWTGYLLLGISTVFVYGMVQQVTQRTQAGFWQDSKFFRENLQPMLIYDVQTYRFLAANVAAQKCYGFSESEFLGLTIHDIRPQEDIAGFKRLIQADTSQSNRLNLGRHLTRQGQSFAVRVNSHAIDFQGKPARLAMISEVEDLVQNEKQVRQLNLELTEFRFAIAWATIMATIDNEGHFTEVNENLVRVTGQDKTHLIGSPFSLTLAGDDAEARREQIMTGLHNHRIWRGELRHQTKEGNPFWTQSFFIPFNHHSGRLTHAILIYTDITERKRSEEATLRREEYLRSLVQSQSSYLIRTDLEGKFTFVNRRFEEKFSFLTDTFIGHPYMNTIDPGDFEACQQMAMTCITEPGKIVPLQIRKPTPDGGYYYTDWEFVGIQNEKGEVEEIQGIGQDATERLRNQRHILSQNKRLRQIAWTSSHELRRPVANIMGLVSLIKASQCCEDGFVDPLEVSIMALDDIIRDIVQKTYEAEEEAQNIKDQSDQP